MQERRPRDLVPSFFGARTRLLQGVGARNAMGTANRTFEGSPAVGPVRFTWFNAPHTCRSGVPAANRWPGLVSSFFGARTRLLQGAEARNAMGTTNRIFEGSPAAGPVRFTWFNAPHL